MRRSLSFCHCKACCDHLYRISRQGVQPDRRDERDELTTASWRRLMKSYSSIFSCAFGTGGHLLCVGGFFPTRSAGLGQHVAMAWSVGKIRFAFGVRLHICFNTRPDFHCPLRHRHRRAASFEPDMGLQPLNGASGHNEIHCPFWVIHLVYVFRFLVSQSRHLRDPCLGGSVGLVRCGPNSVSNMDQLGRKSEVNHALQSQSCL